MMSVMQIARVQVEDGFLDGLDLSFAPGLNVIIGARGVGKTSVLEVIRYGLRLEHVDERRAAQARQHAEAILAGGRVTITCIQDGQRFTVTRTANDLAGTPLGFEGASLPLMLGQNELEGIGLDRRSRLRLIDTHAGVSRASQDPELARLAAEAESLTLQLRSLNLQRDGLRQQELIRTTVVRDLEAARKVEAEILSRADADISEVRRRLGEAAARTSELKRAISAAETLSASLEAAVSTSRSLQAAIKEMSDEAGRSEDLGRDRPGLIAAAEAQAQATQALQSVISDLGERVSRTRIRITELEDEIRPARRQFEEFEAGAGAAAQATAQLEQQLVEIDAALSRATHLEDRAADLLQHRSELMQRIDGVREGLWQARERAVGHLNDRFAPRIRLELDHYGEKGAYISALAAALRGSGLQHNQVAEWLADRVSPQELVDAVEAGDSARLALLGEITSSRVDKLVAHLANAEALGTVLTAAVDDRAAFELLVGRDYKPTEALSTGQRCAVVLPLLLADERRVLLLDQPEDHLDNAYLVENTVRTLAARASTAQTIVVTHNANIPVLGDASLVICLESDGRRGYVREAGQLTTPAIVRAITELMEGGEDAFARRARFYGETGS